MQKRMMMVGLALWIGLVGCALPSTESGAGLVAVFDGVPRIVDSAVIYQGSVIGHMGSREWRHGVTRVTLDLDSPYDQLAQSNVVVIAQNGRLHLKTVSGYGEPLPSGACINGFVNNISYRWFVFTNLLHNITNAAQQRAQRLQARSAVGT